MRNPAFTVPRILAAAAVVAALVSSGCASSGGTSAPETEFSRPGVYLGVYGIKSYEQFKTSGSGVTAGDSDPGIGARVGYRATPRVALEVVAEDVKGFSLSKGVSNTDLDLVNLGVMGKYFLATDRIQPYLLAGAGAARSDIRNFNLDHDGGFLRAGLGADFYLTRSIAVFGEANYNRMVGGVSDLHHVDLQVGLLIRF